MGAEATVRLFGGIVAHNEERRIEGAIDSLLDQQLPPGVSWAGLCIVASGCTDRTEEIVRARAERDPRIELVVQAQREGKSSALVEVFQRARGDYLILLNGDAHAEPGAMLALLQEARAGPARPAAVMAHPVPAGPPGAVAPATELLWKLHHRFHAEQIRRGTGSHLSDELLLLSLPALPPLRPGIINDGAFIGVTFRREGASLGYASGAYVAVAVPRGLRAHIRQRRRILYGHAQVEELAGAAPTTLQGRVLRHPVEVARILIEEARGVPRGLRALFTLAAAEGLASLLARVDRGSSGVDHTRWRRVATVPAPLEPSVGRENVGTERSESA